MANVKEAMGKESNDSLVLTGISKPLVVTFEGKEYRFSEFNPDKNRYSDEDLATFKNLILAKRERAWFDYKNYAPNEGNGTDSTSPTYKGITEEGAASLSIQESNELAQRQLTFINDLDSGLVRIETKNFGICEKTKKLIHPRRMIAAPHCTLSIEAKLATIM